MIKGLCDNCCTYGAEHQVGIIRLCGTCYDAEYGEEGELPKFRNLTGIFFRHQVDGKRENVCFEELGEVRQREILSQKEVERKDNMIIALCNTINEIGERYGISEG